MLTITVCLANCIVKFVNVLKKTHCNTGVINNITSVTLTLTIVVFSAMLLLLVHQKSENLLRAPHRSIDPDPPGLRRRAGTDALVLQHPA